jgi:L-fuconolactonase
MEGRVMAVIDAHHHYWKTAAQDQPWRTHAHAVLERDFEPADLAPELDAAGVGATVVMQSVDEPAENVRLADYARHPRVAGVVAWAPIRDTRAALAELDSLTIDKLSGIRCLIADDPLAWLTAPDSLAFFREVAARSLSWDVVPITAAQTRQVIALAEAVPELRVIVDHLGRPPIDSRGWEPWAGNVRELARNPGVAVKVSVGIDALTAWSAWSAPELERYVEHACAEFGPARLLLASNWPVVLLRTDYATAWFELRELVRRFLPSEEDQRRLTGANAEAWYRLPPFTSATTETQKSIETESAR